MKLRLPAILAVAAVALLPLGCRNPTHIVPIYPQDGDTLPVIRGYHPLRAQAWDRDGLDYVAFVVPDAWSPPDETLYAEEGAPDTWKAPWGIRLATGAWYDIAIIAMDSRGSDTAVTLSFYYMMSDD